MKVSAAMIFISLSRNTYSAIKNTNTGHDYHSDPSFQIRTMSERALKDASDCCLSQAEHLVSGERQFPRSPYGSRATFGSCKHGPTRSMRRAQSASRWRRNASDGSCRPSPSVICKTCSPRGSCPLAIKQHLLPLNAPGVPRQGSVVPDNSMTGYSYCEVIGRAGARYTTHSLGRPDPWRVFSV